MKKKARVVLFLTAGILFVMLIVSITTRDKNTVLVETVNANSQGIYNSVLAKGTIEALETISLSYNNPAVVKELYVQEGDIVTENQKLLTLAVSNTSLSLSDEELTSISNQIVEGRITTSDELQNALSVFLPSGNETNGSKTITINSPISGTIMKAPDVKGSQIFPGVSYIKISDLKKLKVRAKIPEMYIGQIKEGQDVNISGDALEGKTYSGKVQAIMPYASKTISFTGQGNQSYIESLIAFNGGENLRPGYTVDVKIFTDKQDNAILVPYEAVTQIGKIECAYVYKNGRAYQREVTTGYELENQIQIKSGVNKNEEIILNPSENLKNGSKVKKNEVEK